MLTSELSGLGALAISINLADKRSARAFSAGPKMVAAVRWWLFFLELDLVDFAIVNCWSVVDGCLDRLYGEQKNAEKKNATFWRGRVQWVLGGL